MVTPIMKFNIDRHHPITEVQEEFSLTYPFLKIEFEPSQTAEIRQAGLQQNVPEEEIEISDSMKVAELEKMLEDRFGISAQVYRKSGNLWIETRMTRHWTLAQQNGHGEALI